MTRGLTIRKATTLFALALAVGLGVLWSSRPPPEKAQSRPTAVENRSEIRSRVKRVATESSPTRPAAVDRWTHGSHPSTPRHERIRRENALIGALNDALDLADAPRLRALVKQYRTLDPDDVYRLQAGYEHLADCIEYPGELSRSAAEHYYRTERASTLRRFIRRICLERPS